MLCKANMKEVKAMPQVLTVYIRMNKYTCTDNLNLGRSKLKASSHPVTQAPSQLCNEKLLQGAPPPKGEINPQFIN